MRIKLTDAITKKAFIGFMITIFIFFFMNVDIDWTDWTELKFVIYVLMIGALVVLEIPRPGISAFMTDVFVALNDGKLSPSEKLQIIQSAKDNLFGQWADLSNAVEEEKIKEEEKIPDPEEPSLG